MKNFVLFILISFFAVACAQKNTVVISGKITNPVDEPTGIRINYLDRNDTVLVYSDGTFFTEIELEDEHLAWFGHGYYAVPLYLVPGAKINLEFDTNEFEGWIYSNARISGKKSKPSAFLYALDLDLNNPLREELAKMKIDSFMVLMKNLEQTTSADIEKYKSKNSTSDLFVQRIQLKQNSELAQKYLDYSRYYKKGSMEDKQILDSLSEFMDKIPPNDEENCKEISEYNYFLNQYHQYNIDTKMQASGLHRETVAYINKHADEIAAIKAPQNVKDAIGKDFLYYYYKRDDSLQQVYRSRYKDVVKKQENIDDFEKTVTALDNLKHGNIAPNFNYPDINGKMVSSESLRGKVIYIDVWATWCGPCKQEFPYQKKLETELQGQDIVFVSISVDYDKDKEAWKNMVKEKELGGYQLYASGDWESKIAKDYAIRGIPFFIIIDKEGKLVEVNASRPSKPETKEKLLKLARS